MAFDELGIEVGFEGEGVNEKGYIIACHGNFKLKKDTEVVSVDSRYFRPTEVDLLIGDASKAREKLGWVPEYDLKALVKDMVQSDLKLMQKDKYLQDGGYKILSYFE